MMLFDKLIFNVIPILKIILEIPDLKEWECLICEISCVKDNKLPSVVIRVNAVIYTLNKAVNHFKNLFDHKSTSVSGLLVIEQ